MCHQKEKSQTFWWAFLKPLDIPKETVLTSACKLLRGNVPTENYFSVHGLLFKAEDTGLR